MAGASASIAVGTDASASFSASANPDGSGSAPSGAEAGAPAGAPAAAEAAAAAEATDISQLPRIAENLRVMERMVLQNTCAAAAAAIAPERSPRPHRAQPTPSSPRRYHPKHLSYRDIKEQGAPAAPTSGGGPALLVRLRAVGGAQRVDALLEHGEHRPPRRRVRRVRLREAARRPHPLLVAQEPPLPGEGDPRAVRRHRARLLEPPPQPARRRAVRRHRRDLRRAEGGGRRADPRERATPPASTPTRCGTSSGSTRAPSAARCSSRSRPTAA